MWWQAPWWYCGRHQSGQTGRRYSIKFHCWKTLLLFVQVSIAITCSVIVNTLTVVCSHWCQKHQSSPSHQMWLLYFESGLDVQVEFNSSDLRNAAYNCVRYTSSDEAFQSGCNWFFKVWKTPEMFVIRYDCSHQYQKWMSSVILTKNESWWFLRCCKHHEIQSRHMWPLNIRIGDEYTSKVKSSRMTFVVTLE